MRGRFWAVLAILLASAPSGRDARAQLIEGIESWAEATVGLSTRKWRGPRVPMPVPRERPALEGSVASAAWPVRVAWAKSPETPASRYALPETWRAERAAQVLAAAEATYATLRGAGMFASFGDAGQGGTGARDVYLVDAGANGADAAIDASGNFSALDGARAYALVDARVPSDRLFACTAQAVLEAELFELDPAEATSVRKASAAYFAYLVSGELGCDGDPELPPASNPFAAEGSASGAEWLVRLGARQDGNRGTFLYDMWQLARQRTWEGLDLRASPDLFEAIGKALELQRESFASVAAELAETEALRGPRLRELSASALPAFLSPLAPALEPLGSTQLLVRLDPPQPGARLRIWSKGQPGARYALSATRLSAQRAPLARLEVEPRKDPSSQLSVELDADTHAVLVAVTHVGGGVPDPDTFALEPTRSVALIVDLKR